jgi:hypothetical protein
MGSGRGCLLHRPKLIRRIWYADAQFAHPYYLFYTYRGQYSEEHETKIEEVVRA